jgi:hypothetical protein
MLAWRNSRQRRPANKLKSSVGDNYLPATDRRFLEEIAQASFQRFGDSGQSINGNVFNATLYVADKNRA